MVLFTLTTPLKLFINTSSIENEDKQIIIKRGYISHRDLITLYKQRVAKEGPKCDYDLLKLLKGSKIYEKPKPERKKTPEFIKQMKELRLKQQEFEYQKMVNPDFKNGSLHMMLEIQQEEKNGIDHKASQVTKEVKSELTTVVNIIVTVVSVAYAIWYWTGVSTNMELHYRILCSLFFSILALVAESVVYGGYVKKVEKARADERSKKNTYKVVDTIKFKNGRVIKKRGKSVIKQQ